VTSSSPRFWVVVPARNEAARIGGTLAALATQTDKEFALVVVDNASTDGTADVVRRFGANAPFRVDVVAEPMRGPGPAADTGFRHAIGEGAVLLARTDADCLPAPDWVAAAKAALNGAEMACGRSVPRWDEHPNLAERRLLPVVARIAGLCGGYRPAHRHPRYLTPYVLCHGHNIAITADLYLRCGGTPRVAPGGPAEDLGLINRAREHSRLIIRAERMVVGHSLRRLRAWGARRTLLWYTNRRYAPVAVLARRARRRDRRVYLASHPVIFGLLTATRGRPVIRLGRTLLVQSQAAYIEALTRLPLDRTADRTTGGLAREFVADGVLFDQDGQAHRDARRSLAADLSTAGVDRLRPVWREVLSRRLAPLGAGQTVDMTDVTAELAGATVCALLELDADPLAVARAASDVAAAAAHAHLPGIHPPGASRLLTKRTYELIRFVGADRPDAAGAAAMLAVAAVNTTVAGLPRAVAWCADCGLWPQAACDPGREVLTGELLRVTAATGVLPRVAAADSVLDGRKVRAGDRLLLVARHAAGAHHSGPDCDQPAEPRVAQLVFGAGAHACPGAALARAQLSDTLQMLAPYQPIVVRARPDRRSALPGWRSLIVRPGTP
jgi:cytochrome P450/GT2 family glycosyltransferase